MKKTYIEVDKALKENNVEKMKILSKDKVNNFAYEDNCALYYASQFNLIDMFEVLIKHPQIRRNKIQVEGFRAAMIFNNNEILNTYLKQKTLKKFQNELKENISDYFIEYCSMVVEEFNSKDLLSKEDIKNTVKINKKTFDIIFDNFDKKEILSKFKEKSITDYLSYKRFFCLEEMFDQF